MVRAQRLIGILALTACADGGAGTAPEPLGPPVPVETVTGLRGTVDVAAATLTFEPVPRHAISGHLVGDPQSTGIYGNQGVTVQLFNSPVVVAPSLTLGKETYSANVGIQNLLGHPIGDEEADTPLDTNGVFVFLTAGPTVTGTSSACTPACTVTVRNAHGRLDFSAQGQTYWHWRERIGAVGSGSDTSRTRQTWIFEADTQVTSFQFDVLVSAHWPPPHETRWKVQYSGDSLPDTQTEPRWRRTNLAGVALASGGVLSTTTLNNIDLEFYRLDSLSTTANAYAEARVRFNSTGGRPRAAIFFNDGVRFVALGIQNGDVGFIRNTTSFPFILSWPVTTSTFRAYQVRKYAADSAVIYVDGVRTGAITYASLSADLTAGTGTRFQFGLPRVAASSNADWDYVIYEIGVTQP